MKINSIQELADTLGYSVGTVSRAINNKKGVSEKTREKILASMEEMGYHPNRISQNFTQEATHLIGVIVPDLTNPFFGPIITSIEETLEQHGYQMLVFDSHWDAEKEQKKIRIALTNRVDGILLKPASPDIDFLQNINVPCVLFSQEYSNRCNWVDVDNFYAGYLATEHLIRGGYRKICFVGGIPDNILLRKRRMGYEAALNDYSIPVQKSLIQRCAHSMQDGYQLAEGIMQSPEQPDAFFCCDDLQAFGILSYAQSHGISIPDEMGIIGFNNSLTAQMPQISLTSMDQPAYQIGQTATTMLINQIDFTGEIWHPQKIMLTPHLEVRNSTRAVDTAIPSKLFLSEENNR